MNPAIPAVPRTGATLQPNLMNHTMVCESGPVKYKGLHLGKDLAVVAVTQHKSLLALVIQHSVPKLT